MPKVAASGVARRDGWESELDALDRAAQASLDGLVEEVMRRSWKPSSGADELQAEIQRTLDEWFTKHDVRGTLVVASDGIAVPAGQASITVRTHYIDDDAAEAITDRAKAMRSGITTLRVVDTGEGRDALADILGVMGDAPRLLTLDILKRLAALDETAYDGWTFGDLKRVLETEGEEPKKSNGRMVVHRDHVLRALANRDGDASASTAG
ncbi:hypothetical protein QFZ49_003298 [Streptomyces turgidiscabies]|uniref:Uncharacterized protein n=1 Tax=Streptomyces turgidiscabies TaxID=85558 RepID=A0ABU0RNR2_9ACTN|nr:hypothetical protein [Streptomyces turgidiscabies]